MFDVLLFVVIFIAYLYLAFPNSFEQPSKTEVSPTKPQTSEAIECYIPCISDIYESEFLGFIEDMNNIYNVQPLDILNLQSIRQLKFLASTVKLPRYGKMTKDELAVK